MFGICNESTISYVTAAASRYPGVDTDSGSYGWQPNASGNDDTRFNGSVVRQETGTALANDDILQFAYDADTDRLWVGKTIHFYIVVTQLMEQIIQCLELVHVKLDMRL